MSNNEEIRGSKILTIKSIYENDEKFRKEIDKLVPYITEDGKLLYRDSHDSLGYDPGIMREITHIVLVNKFKNNFNVESWITPLNMEGLAQTKNPLRVVKNGHIEEPYMTMMAKGMSLTGKNIKTLYEFGVYTQKEFIDSEAQEVNIACSLLELRSIVDENK